MTMIPQGTTLFDKKLSTIFVDKYYGKIIKKYVKCV